MKRCVVKKQARRHLGILPASATVLVAAALAWGQHTPVPHGASDAVVTTPTTQGAATQEASGHPKFDFSAPTTMPAGHPTTGPAASMPAHPGGFIISSPTSGALRVLISQGTKDGTAINQDAVTVELYSKGKILQTYQPKINAKGAIELHDLPLDPPYQPVVTVTHGGAPQQMVCEVIYKYQPAIDMEMKVYEATETAPAWTIGIRHVVTEVIGDGKTATGLKVVEMVGGFNPTDRAWIGALTADKQRETMSIKLPEGATDVIFGPGMLEAGAKATGGRIVRPGTMLPGSTQYVFSYTVPVKEGKATLQFTAPADETLFAVYAPAGTKVANSGGLDIGKAQGKNGDDGMVLVKGKNVKAGTVSTVELSDLVLPAKPSATQARPEGHP